MNGSSERPRQDRGKEEDPSPESIKIALNAADQGVLNSIMRVPLKPVEKL